MRNSLTKAALGLAGLVLLAGCAGPSVPAGSAAVTPVPAAQATQDQLAFTATTVDARPFSGQSLRGKPGVLWFWAPWCTTCQGEAPSVAKVARANPAVTFVGVAALDQVPAMQKFVSTYQVGGFTHLADTDAAVWRQFGITAQPAFAFISPDGMVSVVPSGMSERELSARVASLARP